MLTKVLTFELPLSVILAVFAGGDCGVRSGGLGRGVSASGRGGSVEESGGVGDGAGRKEAEPLKHQVCYRA